MIGDKPGSVGGVPILWAGATDFDLWRQYGWRDNKGVGRPVFKDAETQCAPYAVMLLNRARKNIVRGSVTLIGNEYYQIGDVVYINSRDILFYVTTVRHNFSYEGGTFTTTLDLQYGHPLGEYIPTPLDVIGKGLIKNQRNFNRTVSSRETAGVTLGVHLGLVKFKNETTDDEFKSMLSGTHEFFNVNELKNSLVVSRIHIGESKIDSYPKVEVRGFMTSDEDKDKVQSRIDAVIKWLKGPDGRWQQSPGRYISISDDRYRSQALGKYHISSFKEPILVTSETTKKTPQRLPKEEVYSISDDGKPNNIIELVLVYEEIKSE